MKSKKWIGLLGVVLFATTIIILVILPYKGKTFKILTVKDSDAYRYAKKESIDVEVIADTEKDFYTEKKENFSYDIYQDGIVITDYTGVSEELIVPRMIDGKFVLAIQQGAFQKDQNLKKVILPRTLMMLSQEDFEKIEIQCYRSNLCNQLKDEENLQVTVLSDSDSYPWVDDSLGFEYNFGDTIEIVKYKGTEKNLVIPETINGYEVTAVNLKLEDDIQSIYLPETVKEIHLNSKQTSYSNTFWLIIVMDVLALILFLGMMMKSSSKDKKDVFYEAPFILVSFLYLIGVYGYSIFANVQNQEFKTVLLVLVIASIIYPFLSLLLLASKKRIQKQDEEIAHIDRYVKDTLELLEELDTTNYDSEVKAIIEEAKDIIRYSDPVSSDQTASLEVEIQRMIRNSQNNVEEWNKIKASLQKRNRICKENK